jgi:SAM-dependent MidA family methyltransferase
MYNRHVEIINKGEKVKNLTDNQKKAMDIFYTEFIETSDFTGEDPENPVEYVFINELIDALVDKGWTVKAAEGTVGSLCETKFMELAIEKGPFGHKEDLWAVYGEEVA